MYTYIQTMRRLTLLVETLPKHVHGNQKWIKRDNYIQCKIDSFKLTVRFNLIVFTSHLIKRIL
jgi:hypothetical protein